MIGFIIISFLCEPLLSSGKPQWFNFPCPLTQPCPMPWHEGGRRQEGPVHQLARACDDCANFFPYFPSLTFAPCSTCFQSPPPLSPPYLPTTPFTIERRSDGYYDPGRRPGMSNRRNNLFKDLFDIPKTMMEPFLNSEFSMR